MGGTEAEVKAVATFKACQRSEIRDQRWFHYPACVHSFIRRRNVDRIMKEEEEKEVTNKFKYRRGGLLHRK
jgi:hypothetical protein